MVIVGNTMMMSLLWWYPLKEESGSPQGSTFEKTSAAPKRHVSSNGSWNMIGSFEGCMIFRLMPCETNVMMMMEALKEGMLQWDRKFL